MNTLCLKVKNAQIEAENYIKTISAYTEIFTGRGIVICGGGPVYFANAWVCINMLRHLGCALPIELWYLGHEEMDERMRTLVKPMDVACVDAHERAKIIPCELSSGWELKPYAILHSSFKEVLFLDADNVPVQNPEYCFNTEQYESTGAIFWGDTERFGPDHLIWGICGVEYKDEPEVESGQMLLNKEKCWKALNLCNWYNRHSDFYYKYIYGDKDTFHLAFRKIGTLYSMPTRILTRIEGTNCHYDFAGNIIFQHRNYEKWNLFGPNKLIEGFVYEDQCFKFLRQLRHLWNGLPSSYKFNRYSNEKTVAETLGAMTVRRFLYERIGYDSRVMTFLSNGKIGKGSAGCELFWNVLKTDSQSVLILSSDKQITCKLYEYEDGKWRGKWLHHERMDIQLTPI